MPQFYVVDCVRKKRLFLVDYDNVTQRNQPLAFAQWHYSCKPDVSASVLRISLWAFVLSGKNA